MARRKVRCAVALVAAGVCASLFAPASAAPGDSGIRATGAPWNMGAGLTDDALDISGVACAPDRLVCALVSDETRTVRILQIQNQTLIPGRQIKLLPDDVEPGKGKKLDESDAEAVDYANGYFYVAGSHSRSRKSKEEKPTRGFIYRIPVDAKGNVETTAPERSARLRDALKALSQFSNREINIEGLAVRDGKIYLGFREPVVNGVAYVVETTVDRVFGTSNAELKPHPMKLAGASGIRDLIKVSDGFLVLAGPEQDVSGPAYVHFWPGKGSDTKLLGEIPRPKDPKAKPEALLLLGEDQRDYRVLVFSDGVAGGEPTEYLITKSLAGTGR